MSTTTVAVSKETKEMLRKLGEKGESYDSIIRTLIEEVSWKRLDNRWNTERRRVHTTRKNYEIHNICFKNVPKAIHFFGKLYVGENQICIKPSNFSNFSIALTSKGFSRAC